MEFLRSAVGAFDPEDPILVTRAGILKSARAGTSGFRRYPWYKRAVAADSLLERASRLALFADLDRDELGALLTHLEEASFDEGKWIVRRGDEEVGLHIIVDGEVGVVLEDEELTTLRRGSFFGEVSALLHEPTVADVVARSPVRCLLVPHRDVERFLLESPRVMLRILQTEARRLRMTDELRT